MSKVDRAGVERILDLLVDKGVLLGWQRRPLSIYHLFLWDGTRLTPSTKETAMWVMGASAVVAHDLYGGSA